MWMLCLQDGINQALLMFFSPFEVFTLLSDPGVAAWSPVPARGLGLNLGYAKNEADWGSRHRSLVSCTVKTISSFYSVFLSFYDSPPFLLSLTLWLLLPSNLSEPCFRFFFSESKLDPFFSRSQSRELEDEIFSMAQKRLCDTYSDVCGLA